MIKKIIKNKFLKAKVIICNEKDDTIEVYKIIKRYLNNDKITEEEKNSFKNQIKDYFRLILLSVITILPGSVVTMPLIIKLFDKFDISIIPNKTFKKKV